MTLRTLNHVTRYRPRLLGLMLAGIAARFTVESNLSQALYGVLVSSSVLILCLLLHLIPPRSPRATARARWGGVLVALLGIASAAIRLTTEDWLPAVFIALLAVQVGAFVAVVSRVQLWVILSAGFLVLICSATQTYSSLFLLCAAGFIFIALDLLILDYRDLREPASAFVTVNAVERRSGGLGFAVVTVLLAIPLYLFVPKPSGWRGNDLQTNDVVAPRPAAPLPTSLVPTSPSTSPSITPVEDGTLTEIPAQVAQPDQGKYGEEFAIDAVNRRKPFANTIVLHARSSHPVNLRGRIYDRFTAARWSRSPIDSQRLELTSGLQLTGNPAGATPVQQSIDIALNLDPTLLHAPGVQRLRFPGTSLLRYQDGVLVMSEPLRAGTAYSIESWLELRAGRYLLQEPPPTDLTPYLQADGTSVRVRELAKRVTAGASNPLTQALALEQYLRTHYTYSYETVAQQNYTPLERFLFDSKRGHCEFFASALAMLLRSVGIPSRLATGFTLSAPNPITGFYEVRALDGHAWVEAYLQGLGWLMLEPTPFYPLPTSDAERSIAAQLERYLQRRAATSELLAPDAFQTQLTVLACRTWHGIWAGQRAFSNLALRLGWRWPLVLAAISMVMLALYLTAAAAIDWLDALQIRRSLDALPEDARAATLGLATLLLRTTAPRCLVRRADWTLQEYAQQLSLAAAGRNFPSIPADFIAAFDTARYAAATTPDTTSLSKVITIIREQLALQPWPRLRVALNRLRTMRLRAFRRRRFTVDTAR